MLMPLRAAALVLAFALPAPLAAQEGSAQADSETGALPDGAGGSVVTLEQALLAAYRFNPQLEAERSNLRGTDERYAQALAAFGPSLSLEARYDHARDRIGRAGGGDFRGDAYTVTARAVLDQPLFTSGRLSAGKSSARAQVDFGRQSLRSVETQVLQAAIAAYVSVRLNRELVAIARANLDALERQRSGGRARFKVREITLTDFEQIVSQAELARARVETAQAEEAAAEAEFYRVVGALPGELAPPPVLADTPAELDDALALADLDSPLLLAARARERASRAETDRARAATLPTVSLEARREYSPVTPYADDPNQTQTRAGVVLRMPLFTSGALSAQVREAREANDADWHLADRAMREARSETALRWARMVGTRAAVARLEASVAAAQEAFRGAEIQQRAGDRSTQDVLDLARELLNAQASLATTAADTYLAQSGLLAAIGKLELADLLPDDATYDPRENFREAVRATPGAAFAGTIGQVDALAAGSTKEDRSPRDPAAALMPGNEAATIASDLGTGSTFNDAFAQPDREPAGVAPVP